jgi:hypothetical protein
MILGGYGSHSIHTRFQSEIRTMQRLHGDLRYATAGSLTMSKAEAPIPHRYVGRFSQWLRVANGSAGPTAYKLDIS